MEHITFQVYDAPDLKVTLYRPLPDNNTVVRLAKLLEEYQDTNSLTPIAVEHLPDRLNFS